MALRAWKQQEDILKIVEWLWMMPLLSLPELKAVTGLTYDRCNRLVKILYREGKVSSVRLGMTLEVQDRHFLTTSGVRYALAEVQAKLEWQVSQRGLQLLIGRLPSLEAFYRLAPRIWGHDGVERINPIRVSPDPDVDEVVFPPDLPLKRFQWQRDSNIHAISEYANGAWLPWVWIGPMTKETMLGARRLAAEQKLFERSQYAEQPVPAGWVIIGSDQLAAAQAAHVWKDEDALVTTVDGCTMSSLRPREFDWPRYDYATVPDSPGFPERIPEWMAKDSALPTLTGKLPFALFQYIAQWPALRLKHLHQHFRHSHGEINAALKKIAEGGLIVRLDGGHYLTRHGMLAAARMDRISHQSLYGGFDGYLRPDGSYRRSRQRHDQAVADVILAWERAGGAAFHGRRAVLNVANEAQLAPDAVMTLPRADGTLQLWLAEVELSAEAPSSARRKLQPYRMYLQRNGRPVALLMIVGTEAAEKAFLREGRGLGILVTTVERLLASGPLGEGVWREAAP